TFYLRLADQPAASGATLVPARVTEVSRAAGRWHIGAGARTLTAGWLLGADGAAGVAREQVFRAFERAQLSIAAGCFVDGVDAREVVIRFVDRPQGYLWSFSRRAHLAGRSCVSGAAT